MNKVFILLSFILFISSCRSRNNKDIKQSIIPIVRIDTIIVGTPGQKGYAITINYKKDTTLLELHEKCLFSTKAIDFRNRYYDGLGKYRYGCYLFHHNDNDFWTSHTWSGKDGEEILNIDSEFVNNKLSECKITICKKTAFDNDDLEYIITRKYKSNKIYSTFIDDFNSGYSFAERGNNYYMMNATINIRYAEWDETSKAIFGLTYTNAINGLYKARLRIDTAYLSLAKNRHGMDLKAYLQKEFGIFD